LRRKTLKKKILRRKRGTGESMVGGASHVAALESKHVNPQFLKHNGNDDTLSSLFS